MAQAANVRAERSAARGGGQAQRGRNWTALAYLGPAIIGILLINVYPIFYTFYTSLTNRNNAARFPEGKYQVTTTDGIPWLPDFANYTRLLTNSTFYTVFGKSLLYAAICVFFFFVVGLMFALILNNPYIKGRGIFRTLMILPWAVPFWITALIWKFLFHDQYGPINQILRLVGISSPPPWLLDGTWAFAAITIVNIWLSYPFFMLILLGGLQSIPDDIYEAADLDGASYWTKLMSLTIPLLRPVALPAIILSVIQTLKIFETIWLMTRGGPYSLPGRPGATELLIVWAYNNGFQGQFRFGLVAAFSIVVFILLLIMTLTYTRVTNATKAVYE